MPRLKQLGRNLPEISSYAFPIFIEQVAVALMSALTAVMVSHLSIEAVSGVNMVDTINVLIQQIFLSLEIGTTVVVAQFCGRGARESASDAALQGMLSALLLATVICLITFLFPDRVLSIVLGNAPKAVYDNAFVYFSSAVLSFPFLAVYVIATAAIRGSGSPLLSLAATVVTNVLFAAFGAFFMYGLKIGVLGVGIALILARAVGAAVGVWLLMKKTKTICVKSLLPRRFLPEIQKPILLIGIPACIENMIFTAGRLLTQTFVVPLGTEMMAANAISNSISSIYLIPGNTASATTTPLVGKYLGAGNREKAVEISRHIIFFIYLIMIALSFVMSGAAPFLAAFFTPEVQVQKTVTQLCIIYFFVSAVLWIPSFVPPAALRASGDVKYTAVVSVISMLGIRVGAAWLFVNVAGLGVFGVWLGMYCDWVLRGVLFGIRYLKGGWARRRLV